MNFLKIGRNLFNVHSEIAGFEFPDKSGVAKLYLNTADDPMEFTGLIAEALSWFFSINDEPRQQNGSKFFVFDLIWGFKNRKLLETYTRVPVATLTAAMVEAMRGLDAKISNLAGSNLAGTQPASDVYAPAPITAVTHGVEQPQPVVRTPRLNTFKIKEAVARKGSGPAQFFPGEKRETPGDPRT